MPVSIQLVPPETRKWNQRSFPTSNNTVQASRFSVRCVNSSANNRAQRRLQRRAPSHRIIPETSLPCHTTSVANCFLVRLQMRQSIVRRERNGSLSFHFFGEQAYQGDVYLPRPSNLFLAFIEGINKPLSSIFWQGLVLGRDFMKPVCSPTLLPRSSWQALRPDL